MSDNKVMQVYKATSVEDQQAAYDSWADNYERDLCAMGYRLPALVAGVFTRFVAPDVGPILDAGCGGGLQAEALAQLGYGPLIGLDLSEGMLGVARRKGIYADLHQGALGPQIDLPDGSMQAVLCIGTITPNHAPPESFDGLIRVAAPGAPIIFSLRDDAAQDEAYFDAVARLEQACAWEEVWSSESIHSMPYGVEDVTHRVHVYRTL
ncbi:MAG: class I SAM-dependent methyltransferase [Pseudomonadota bacterium]